MTGILSLTIAELPASAQISVLYNFGVGSNDPTHPGPPGLLAQGQDGNLYTTAPLGGVLGSGSVFDVTPTGTLTRLYDFDYHGTGATSPESGLTLGTDGNFYGTTTAGGTSGFGTVFKITPTGTLTVLYNFTGGTDGSDPFAPPVQGTDGNFYGTTSGAGNGGNGTVYKLTASGMFKTLYQFDFIHGAGPLAPLVQGTDGNLYGTTPTGGTQGNGLGTVFKIATSGKLTVLYNFDQTHGAFPEAGLTPGADGNFYGTTHEGGAHNGGAVFKITPAGKLSLVHSFNGTTDGYYTYAGVLQATDGNFYGVTENGGTVGSGTIYSVSPTGKYSVLYDFDGTTAGGAEVTLFQHTNGILYADTYGGGSAGAGTFFSLDAGLGPFVSLLPTSGKVGKTVGILGQGFAGTTAVSFNGTPATIFTVSSDTYLTASVPNGATTGTVMVVTPSGTLTSNHKFLVTPTILNFSPPSGPVGTVVTITGMSLTQTTKVAFGGVAATGVTVNSDAQVTAKVPIGAKTGRIVITTPGGTASSATNFAVTP
jgi:uncharacterized repeat protein (TIGR03803 family)